MQVQFEKKLREFAQLGGDSDFGQMAEQYVTAHADLLERCMLAVLCHNDYHGKNVVLYHALELWDWFAHLGQPAPLANIADDIRTLSISVEPVA